MIQSRYIQFRRLWYKIKYEHLTPQTVVLLVAVVVAASWVWGSVSMIQANFSAQKTVDERQHERDVLELEVATLRYQQNYYQSNEYKDLQARAKLGLVSSGEKTLILPKNSDAVVRQDQADRSGDAEMSQPAKQTDSNFQQWLDFLQGKSAQRLRNR